MSRRRRRQPREVRLHLRLYAGQDDELIRWLEQFDDQPYGTKTRAVKDALLCGMREAPAQEAAQDLDCSARSCQETLTASLADVRRVVEAAVETALARLGDHRNGSGTLQVAVPAVAPSEGDEADDLLDALGESLVVKD